MGEGAPEVPPAARFTCPCCGHRTLGAPAGTTAAPCEVCAWEGRDLAGWRRFCGEALLAGQRSYLATGACDPALVELTRAPRADEARPPWWRTLDDTPAALLAALDRAFADVDLAGGVSLAEADLIDDHALPARTATDPPPRGHGLGPPWQDLTLADLEAYHWGPFAFMDARGIRYYLPALIRFDLRGDRPACLDSLVVCLTRHHQLPGVHRLLDVAQRRVVARWLLYRVLVPGDVGAASARGALGHGWGDHLDADERAAIADG